MGAWGSVVVKALRCAISRMVPVSIPGGVTGFFSDISPSDRSMALGSTQPLAKMSTRNIPGSIGGRCLRLTTSPPSRAECHEIWESKSPGKLWATPGLLRNSFTFTYTKNISCFEINYITSNLHRLCTWKDCSLLRFQTLLVVVGLSCECHSNAYICT